MNGDTLYSIGDLARRTGLTVKTVRYYSDLGIVSPADRNPAGHRRYGVDAVARLDLVRTLRDLGLGLPVIRQVVERESALPAVAAAHADALDVQIRVLRLRRAVLRAVARRGATPEELTLVHQLARLSTDERSRLIGDFLDGVFGGPGFDARFAGVRRSMTPELPDDPEPEQVDAWVELAELAMDDDFRGLLRRLAEEEAAEAGVGWPRPGLAAVVRELAGPAVAAGIDPGSAAAADVVEAVVDRYAGLVGGDRSDSVRARLVERLAVLGDPRRERYLELLAVVNGWAAPESWAAEAEWLGQAAGCSAVGCSAVGRCAVGRSAAGRGGW
ncbi:MerR family transcriptional regulator [Kitasatospora aureofaciens]|uniref:MerR family transcriptional regulator n=1 Tax=Kitasatospora aureofaciens TaxID=1894 RepID=UPI001C4681D2|nr:MerR family transcriptional regulator [Kitasatospora aureofaciens]MBV6698226.1 MerR family transcriptional regulator [Kitasatospora aureofaciens]